MPLTFPNRSRSYDATRRAVRFWGYDSAMETSFYVTEDALKRVRGEMGLWCESYRVNYWYTIAIGTGLIV